MRPLIKTVERRNGKEVVIYRPNPKYPRERAFERIHRTFKQNCF